MLRWRIWLGFFVFVLAIPLIPFAILGELPGQTWVEHPTMGYVVIAGILVLGVDTFLPIPSSLVAVFLGARLGLPLGFLTIFLGLSLGAAIGYYSGWYVGYPLVMRMISEKNRHLLQALEQRQSYFLLAALRSVPVLAEASLLAAGAARLKSRLFFTTILIANAGLALVYAFFGSISQDTDTGLYLFIGGILVPALAFLLFALVNKNFQSAF